MNEVGAEVLVTDVHELKAQSLHVYFYALEIAHKKNAGREFDSVAPHTPAFIFQTSGTTGEAKWVEVSHGHFFAAIEGLWRAGGLNQASGGTTTKSVSYMNLLGRWQCCLSNLMSLNSLL